MNILEFKNMFKAAKRTASNFDEFCTELELYLEAASKVKKAKETGDTDTPEEAFEEIARLIATGVTSGRLDDEEGFSTAWELETNTWREERDYESDSGI